MRNDPLQNFLSLFLASQEDGVKHKSEVLWFLSSVGLGSQSFS